MPTWRCSPASPTAPWRSMPSWRRTTRGTSGPPTKPSTSPRSETRCAPWSMSSRATSGPQSCSDRTGTSGSARTRRRTRLARPPWWAREPASVTTSASTRGLSVGGGFRSHLPVQVERYRHSVDDEATGPEVSDLVAELRVNGFDVEGEQLKTKPRGRSPAHRPASVPVADGCQDVRDPELAGRRLGLVGADLVTPPVRVRREWCRHRHPRFLRTGCVHDSDPD